MNGKILGIVGFGNIGKRVAQIAEILGMEVMVAKNTEKNNAKTVSVIEKDGFLHYDLDEVLEKCDILTLHTPLTELTRDLINLERMKKMKKKFDNIESCERTCNKSGRFIFCIEK